MKGAVETYEASEVDVLRLQLAEEKARAALARVQSAEMALALVKAESEKIQREAREVFAAYERTYTEGGKYRLEGPIDATTRRGNRIRSVPNVVEAIEEAIKEVRDKPANGAG